MATSPPKRELGLRVNGINQSRVPIKASYTPDDGYFSSELNGFHFEEPPTKRAQAMFNDDRTELIVRRIFFKLLSDRPREIIDASILRMFNVEHLVRRRTESDRKLILELTDMFVEFVRHSSNTSVEFNLKEFREQNWRLDSANMYLEFKKVSTETFRDRKHWGKVVGFISFSVAYAIYVHSRGISDAVTSIEAWTRQTVEEDLGEFFTESGGWENMLKFVKSIVARQRRERELRAKGEKVEETPLWQNVVALGTVAAGAVVAYTLTKAFS